MFFFFFFFSLCNMQFLHICFILCVLAVPTGLLKAIMDDWIWNFSFWLYFIEM